MKNASKPVIIEEYGVTSNQVAVYTSWCATMVSSGLTGELFWYVMGFYSLRHIRRLCCFMILTTIFHATGKRVRTSLMGIRGTTDMECILTRLITRLLSTALKTSLLVDERAGDWVRRSPRQNPQGDVLSLVASQFPRAISMYFGILFVHLCHRCAKRCVRSVRSK